MRHDRAVFLMVAAALAAVPDAASAYVGPGAGISAIGSLLALVAAVLLAIVGFVWYPVKRVLRSRKARQAAQKDEAAPS